MEWASVFASSFFHVDMLCVLFGICFGAVAGSMLRAPAYIVKMLSSDG